MRIGPVALSFFVFGWQALSQQPKVTEQEGHLSPVKVKITFLNETSRTMLLRGVGDNASSGYTQFVVRTDGGASERRFWLDSIAAIKGTGSMRTRNSEFTVTLKDGKDIPAQFSGLYCKGEIQPSNPEWDCRILYTYNEDDGDQKIDLQKVKLVEFLAPARKDKAGNAMFDTWRYSPYTGEKLQ